jgi:hypothetical protein
MSQKTQKKSDKKDLKKAQLKEAQDAMTAEDIGEIAAEISLSPIEDTDKAVFLYSIAQGSFNLKLYENYQKLLSDYKEGLLKEAEQVQKQLDSLQEQLDTANGELSEAAQGAVKEIQDACEHVEISTSKELESRAGHKEGKEVEAIRKKLKK